VEIYSVFLDLAKQILGYLPVQYSANIKLADYETDVFIETLPLEVRIKNSYGGGILSANTPISY
jgi:hypothetical protein